MDILNSNWLVNMLRKSAKTPEARMLHLFDILDDWSDAPGIRDQIELDLHAKEATILKTYLSTEAEHAGAALPDMLATQLYFMALSATHEKISGGNPSGLSHAKSAASALISAQTKKEFHISKTSAYSIAASFVGVIIVAASAFFFYQPPQTITPKTASAPESAFKPVLDRAIATPQSTAALVSRIELMRHGNCRLIEALQLPDEHKTIYFQNIVAGQISTDPREQQIVRELLKQIQCDYTPMLMKKST